MIITEPTQFDTDTTILQRSRKYIKAHRHPKKKQGEHLKAHKPQSQSSQKRQPQIFELQKKGRKCPHAKNDSNQKSPREHTIFNLRHVGSRK